MLDELFTSEELKLLEAHAPSEDKLKVWLKYAPEFLRDYCYYTSGNETPTIFHLWTAIATLAGACEKRLWLEQGYFHLNLNQYVILVAPAGLCSKTTALNLGKGLLAEAGYNVASGASTKEKIIEDMVEGQKEFTSPSTKTPFLHCSTSYFASEINVLLSTGMDMVKFLTDIYDIGKLYQYKTKNSGTYDVINPYFNLIGAATPDWFGKNVNEDIIGGGFTARCIVVYEEIPRGKVPIIEITQDQINARSRTVNVLDTIGTMFGAVTYSPEAKDLYVKWYQSQEISPYEDYRIIGYKVRKLKIHVSKLASLLAISEFKYVIEPKHFLLALSLLDITEERMKIAFANVGENQYTEAIRKILRILKQYGWKTTLENVLGKIYKDFKSVDETKKVFELMLDLKLIRKVIEGSTTYLEVIDTDQAEKFLVSA